MTITQYSKIPFLLFIILFFLTGCENKSINPVYQQDSDYDFEDTLLNLDIAISEHNYRIIHRSTIGQAVRDRGEKDFPLSTITNFCNITYAKEMMEINPDLINSMPCNVSVREQADRVIVSTRLMDDSTDNSRQNEFSQRINNNLRSIVDATVE